jgi:hypothetical protein
LARSGWEWGWFWAAQRFARRAAHVRAAAGLVLALIFALGARTNLAPDDWGARYAQAVLKTLPQNAVVFVLGDPDLAPIAYFHMIENQRPDITLVERKGLILGNRLFHPLRTDQATSQRVLEEMIDKETAPVVFTSNRKNATRGATAGSTSRSTSPRPTPTR